MVEGDESDTRDAFIQAYDEATQVWGVAWNLSTGLYWTHPWEFLTLDSQSRHYINKRLGLNVAISSQQGPCDAQSYLKLLDDLRSRFGEDSYPVHSFPDLSLASWLYKDPADEAVPAGNLVDDVAEDQAAVGEVGEAVQVAAPIVPYSVEDILKDGCFLERPEIDLLLDRLRTKKNLILQGPPGTGKTWLAKRLAFALMGQKDDSKVRAVQFHPNLSYEDFVRGWRPTGEGKLSLADGVFMEAIKAASKDPSARFVVVIEEINRGNPAQIFGELLTLLEAGKRTPNEALELCYPDADGKRRPVHIPENLYVVGTMNIADRSLALVDLALRRRFAFVGLEPRLSPAWRDWVVKECAVDPALVADIERRIAELNDQIAADARLGKQFRIGHSYVTPAHRLEAGDTKNWFRQIVETEIGPLLDEYWFDAPDEAQKAIARLTQGW
nr:AAA family ATPase [Aromatoleum aromaticum]